MKMVVMGLMPMLMGGSALGQTPEKAPDTLQALLVEVRQLRQDIEAMTAASQRVQIALYGLQDRIARLDKALEQFGPAVH